MSDEMTRADLLAFLDELGGHGASLEAVDDGYLATIITNKIQLTVDQGRIEKVLRNERLPTDWRAALTMRFYDLEGARRAIEDAKVGRPHVVGGLAVKIPDGVDVTHFYAQNRTVTARVDGRGRRLLDLFRNEYVSLAMGSDGTKWVEANPEIQRSLDMNHTATNYPTE